MPVIKFCNVSQVYHPGTSMQIKSLDDISFEIFRGEMVAIVGATGSGKSTLVKHLNGLLLPAQGQVLINGIATSDKHFRRQLWQVVGLVFQYPEDQLFEETVYADIAFGPRNLALPESEVARRVQEAMSFLELDAQINDLSPFNLSGGQKRRVAIAGVLAVQPEIIVLDEPTAGLDPRGSKQLFGYLKKLQQQKNITIVMVTHNLKEVAKYADRVLALKQGSIIYDSTPGEIFLKGPGLREIGLAMPPVTELMFELYRQGKPVHRDVLTVKEALVEILRVCKK